MSKLTLHGVSFPLGVECIVRFRGEDESYEGVFKKMVTKRGVIFFGNKIGSKTQTCIQVQPRSINSIKGVVMSVRKK